MQKKNQEKYSYYKKNFSNKILLFKINNLSKKKILKNLKLKRGLLTLIKN